MMMNYKLMLKMIDMSTKNLNDLQDKEKRLLFVQIQNEIIPNLNRNQRITYQTSQQTIPIANIDAKIQYTETWREISENNKIIRQHLKWIEKYYPLRYKHIKKKAEILGSMSSNEELIYIKSEYLKLFRNHHNRLQNELNSLLNQIRDNISEIDYDLIFLKIEDFETIEEKIDYLKEKIDKL